MSNSQVITPVTASGLKFLPRVRALSWAILMACSIPRSGMDKPNDTFTNSRNNLGRFWWPGRMGAPFTWSGIVSSLRTAE